MSRLKNPIYGSGVMEKYVYLDTPDTALRLKEMQDRMEAALGASRRIPIDREVIKEVQVESPDLLNRLNAALKELGAIKMDIAKGGNLRLLHTNVARFERPPEPVKEITKEPEKVAEIIRIVKRETFNTRLMIYTITLSFLAGMACLSLFNT